MANNYIKLGDAVVDKMTQELVQALSTLGYYAMMYAYKKHSFKHRTRNLHDSYASAVYVNGQLIERSIRYVGGVLSKKKDYKTKKSGRETVNDWLRSHSFGGKNNEMVLVVIAAMYYAGILESGGKGSAPLGPGDRFIVISPAREYINKHYWTALHKVYNKYGIKEKPKARVIKGESLNV